MSAFSELSIDMQNRLYHFVMGYLKSVDESEDIVQEVFDCQNMIAI
jgi:DNA-directed RNA polymerase specialized sigma24 family protein